MTKLSGWLRPNESNYMGSTILKGCPPPLAACIFPNSSSKPNFQKFNNYSNLLAEMSCSFQDVELSH